jgi:hypothetical protein
MNPAARRHAAGIENAQQRRSKSASRRCGSARLHASEVPCIRANPAREEDRFRDCPVRLAQRAAKRLALGGDDRYRPAFPKRVTRRTP